MLNPTSSQYKIPRAAMIECPHAPDAGCHRERLALLKALELRLISDTRDVHYMTFSALVM